MVITISGEQIKAELIKSGVSRVLSQEERAAFFKPMRGLRKELRKYLPAAGQRYGLLRDTY